MKLTNLSGWYKAIKNQNLTYNVYECKYNHIDFSILFDIGKTPFILSLIKRQTGEVITFNILQGFLIETNLPHDQYYLLRKILNIPDRGESPFSTNKFFEEINEKFPNTILKEINIPVLILNRIYNFEESDKVEYDGLIDWSTSKCGRHHTLKNHEKTRILYPYIYERIKNKDISVRYK